MEMNKLITAAAAAAILSGTAAVSASAAVGDYVVVLKNEPSAMLLDNADGIISHDGRVFLTETYMDALSLAPASEILCIFEDCEAYLFDDAITNESAPSDPYYFRQWGLDAINAPYARERGFTGSGVKVGIVDSGMKRPSHEDLPIPSLYRNAISTATDYEDYGDNYGHGTKVAGIIGAKTNNGIGIAGIAYDAELVPIKITEGKTLHTYDMLAGFTKAVNFGCQVINLSLGYSESSASASTIKSIEKCMQDAADKGVLIIAAAGNDATSVYQYPASYDCVVSVSSVGTSASNNAPSSFSQHNDKVTIAAPGYNIYSTTRLGTYASASGTSFSAPMVSAAAAIAKQINPSITAQEFIDALAVTARDVYTEGYDEYTGWGVLDLKALTEYLYGTAPSPVPPAETEAPELTEKPTPTPTPLPEASTLVADEGGYTLEVVHEPVSGSTRILAAFYEGERLAAVKSVYGVEGNTINKLTYKTDSEITKAEVFGWDFSDSSKPIPVIMEKQTIYTRK